MVIVVLAVVLSVLTLTPTDSALDVIPRIRRSLGSTSEAPPRWCHVTQEGPDHRVSLLSCPGCWLRGAPHPRARCDRGQRRPCAGRGVLLHRPGRLSGDADLDADLRRPPPGWIRVHRIEPINVSAARMTPWTPKAPPTPHSPAGRLCRRWLTGEFRRRRGCVRHAKPGARSHPVRRG